MWAFVVLALVFASGCVKQQDWIDRTLVTVDVTGVWEGTFRRTNGSSGNVVFVLQQQGPKVTGEMKFRASGSMVGASPEGEVRIAGTVSGDTFSFHGISGPQTNGEFQVNGDEMIGSWARLTMQTATLRRQQ